MRLVEASRTDPPGVDPAGPPLCTPDGDSVITLQRAFRVDLTVHMEDVYNFNPGGADLATGTPDDANGRFEITGLGHEYLNKANLTRSFDFETSMEPASPMAGPGEPQVDRAPRTHPPADRRSNPVTR